MSRVVYETIILSVCLSRRPLNALSSAAPCSIEPLRAPSLHLQRDVGGPLHEGVDLGGIDAQPERQPVDRLSAAPRLAQALDEAERAEVLEGLLEQWRGVLVAGRL
jgi:hypothetical protein